MWGRGVWKLSVRQAETVARDSLRPRNQIERPPTFYVGNAEQKAPDTAVIRARSVEGGRGQKPLR